MKKTISFAKFRKLALGDTVTLATPRQCYGHFENTEFGRAFVPAEVSGTVGAILVPAVTGESRFFVCADFSPDTPLETEKRKKLCDENPHRNPYRVAAYPFELLQP